VGTPCPDPQSKAEVEANLTSFRMKLLAVLKASQRIRMQ
jgi:hypothetical protein